MLLPIQGIVSGGAGAATEDRLIFTWETTTTDEVMNLPTYFSGSYDCTVEWGDGEPDSTVTAWDDADAAHTYATAGEYQVKITGQFGFVRFYSTAEEDKLISLDNLGSTSLEALGLVSAFRNCGSMTGITIGDCDTSGVTSLLTAFSGVANNGTFALDLSPMDVSGVTTFKDMASYSLFSSIDMTGWDTGAGTNMDYMFYSNDNLDPSIAHFDITALTTANNMLANAAMSTTNYDALLIAWEGQVELSNVTFHAGSNTKYSTGAATTARGVLTGTSLWTITDAGQL